MKLETVITANQKRFPQFTITKVVDVGNFCIVFVCDDEGCPPLQMPYKVTESGEVSGYDMFDEKLRSAYAAGKVIYLDETPLRDKPPANTTQNLATASAQAAKGDGNTSTPEDTKACVGVLVVSQGRVLSGTRKTEFGHGLICGPGGHIKEGESPKQAAFREAEEEFGISPKELIPLGRGPMEPDTGIQPYIFLCTEYEGEPNCVDGEMADPQFRTLEEIELLTPSLFQPFADDVKLLKEVLQGERDPFEAYVERQSGSASGTNTHRG